MHPGATSDHGETRDQSSGPHVRPPASGHATGMGYFQLRPFKRRLTYIRPTKYPAASRSPRAPTRLASSGIPSPSRSATATERPTAGIQGAGCGRMPQQLPVGQAKLAATVAAHSCVVICSLSKVRW